MCILVDGQPIINNTIFNNHISGTLNKTVIVKLLYMND